MTFIDKVFRKNNTLTNDAIELNKYFKLKDELFSKNCYIARSDYINFLDDYKVLV